MTITFHTKLAWYDLWDQSLWAPAVIPSAQMLWKMQCVSKIFEKRAGSLKA